MLVSFSKGRQLFLQTYELGCSETSGPTFPWEGMLPAAQRAGGLEERGGVVILLYLNKKSYHNCGWVLFKPL